MGSLLNPSKSIQIHPLTGSCSTGTALSCPRLFSTRSLNPQLGLPPSTGAAAPSNGTTCPHRGKGSNTSTNQFDISSSTHLLTSSFDLDLLNSAPSQHKNLH